MDAVIIVRFLFDESEFRRYVEQVSLSYPVFIYDNSPNRLSFDNPNIFYFSILKNIGLMAAINECIKQAILKGYTRCIYFDQDSNINEHLINALFKSYDCLKELDNRLFAVGPLPVTHQKKPYPIRVIDREFEHYFKATEIITSGMVFYLQDVVDIGGFRDDFYIDWGDFELCWRALKNGKHIYVDSNIQMSHEVGVNYIKILNRILPISSPLRNYYQTRNITYVLLHKLTPKNRCLAIYFFIRRMLNVFINIIFIAPRYKRLKFSFKGYLDGVRGRLGEYKSWHK